MLKSLAGHVLLGCTMLLTSAAATALPAAADVSPIVGYLELDATFDKAAYVVGDVLTMTVTVTNTGKQPATGVAVHDQRENPVWSRDATEWGELGAPGTRVEPGQVITVELSKPLVGHPGDEVAVELVLTADGMTHNELGLSAPVKPASGGVGDLTGVVYGDRDDDGQIDDGEALPGIKIHLSKGPTQNTDSRGRFAFLDLSVGDYLYWVDAPGWVDQGHHRRRCAHRKRSE